MASEQQTDKKNTIQTKPKAKLVVRSIIDESWSIAKVAEVDAHPSWKSAFESAIPELKDISEIVEEREKKYGPSLPLRKDLFNAFWLTPANEVTVIILGQDPYHQILSNGRPRAQGLSFSVSKDDTIPSSLSNVYKELSNTVKGFTMPNHGDISCWGQKGVLLLNSSLTVQQNEAGSHGQIWLGFIRKMFDHIAKYNRSCVVMLWGRAAQKIKSELPSSFEILESAHPSGLSCKGFFGCNHFNKCNELLVKQGKRPIDWNVY